MQLASGSPSPPGGRGPSGSPGESIRGLRRLGSRVQAPGTRPRTSRSADGSQRGLDIPDCLRTARLRILRRPGQQRGAPGGGAGPMQYCSLQHGTLLLSPVTSTTGYCFCFGSIPSFFLELFLHWSPDQCNNKASGGDGIPGSEVTVVSDSVTPWI